MLILDIIVNYLHDSLCCSLPGLGIFVLFFPSLFTAVA